MLFQDIIMELNKFWEEAEGARQECEDKLLDCQYKMQSAYIDGVLRIKDNSPRKE